MPLIDKSYFFIIMPLLESGDANFWKIFMVKNSSHYQEKNDGVSKKLIHNKIKNRVRNFNKTINRFMESAKVIPPA